MICHCICCLYDCECGLLPYVQPWEGRSVLIYVAYFYHHADLSCTVDHALHAVHCYIFVPSSCPVLYGARLCHKDCCFHVMSPADLRTDQKTATRTSSPVSTALIKSVQRSCCNLSLIMVICLGQGADLHMAVK